MVSFFEVPNFGAMEFILLFGLLGTLLFSAFLIYLYFNQKYPIVFFDIYEGKVKRKGTRRLIGNKVVPDDLFQIIASGHKIVGENIENFSYVFEEEAFLFILSRVRQVYLAKKVGGALVPLKFEPNQDSLEGQRILSAKSVLIKYFHEMEQVAEELKEKNKIMEALFSSLPFLIYVGAFGLVAFFLTSTMLTKVAELTKNFESIALQNTKIAEINQNITNVNQEIVKSNKELIEKFKNTNLNNTLNETTNNTIVVSG